MIDKVHFEISGPLGILTLANPPLNLFSGELIEDLCAAVTEVKRIPIRALLVRAEGKIFSAPGPMSACSRAGPQAKRASVSPAICD